MTHRVHPVTYQLYVAVDISQFWDDTVDGRVEIFTAFAVAVVGHVDIGNCTPTVLLFPQLYQVFFVDFEDDICPFP